MAYPGTPTLSEVRSLIGAEHFIPFAYCESESSYVLDKSHQYLHVCSEEIGKGVVGSTYTRTVNEEEYQEGLKTGMARWKFGNCKSVELALPIIAQISCVKVPDEDDCYFR